MDFIKSHGRGLDCQISDLELSNAVFRAFVWRCNHFSTSVSGSKFGAIHKRHRPLVRGEESKNWPKLPKDSTKNCQYLREGVKNCWHRLWMAPCWLTLQICPKSNKEFLFLLSYCTQNCGQRHLCGLELNFFGWIQLYPDCTKST